MSALPLTCFHLQRTDEFYGISEPPTLVGIRLAGDEAVSRQEKYLADIKEKAARLIDFGIKSHSPLYSAFCSDYLWHLRYGNAHPKKKILDDTLHRFLWARDHIVCSTRRLEIELTLAACNILGEAGNPLFQFQDGQMEHYPAHDFGETSLSIWEEEIHEKVLEIHPDWKGGPERLGDLLMKEFHLEYQFANLNNTSVVSVFSNSEKYLYSLLEEINRAVFTGVGKIKLDLFEEEPRKGCTEGFTLSIPKNSWNSHSMGYIGMHENGKFEIRIAVKRDKSEFWDTDINGVVDTLQRAIIWWKEFGEYTQEERVQHEEEEKAARLIKEGQDLLFESLRKDLPY